MRLYGYVEEVLTVCRVYKIWWLSCSYLPQLSPPRTHTHIPTSRNYLSPPPPPPTHTHKKNSFFLDLFFPPPPPPPPPHTHTHTKRIFFPGFGFKIKFQDLYFRSYSLMIIFLGNVDCNQTYICCVHEFFSWIWILCKNSLARELKIRFAGLVL